MFSMAGRPASLGCSAKMTGIAPPARGSPSRSAPEVRRASFSAECISLSDALRLGEPWAGRSLIARFSVAVAASARFGGGLVQFQTVALFPFDGFDRDGAEFNVANRLPRFRFALEKAHTVEACVL